MRRPPPKGPRIIENAFPGSIRVISDTGEQLGIMEVADAVNIANERGLDLVEIAPNASPPTCRLMDYGKYKYQQKKKKSQGQKKTVQRQKEVKVRPKTETHDLEVKVNRARSFLEKGHKVQVTMLFRGREAMHIGRGREILSDFAQRLDDIAKIEKEPTREGRNRLGMILSKRTGVKPTTKAPALRRVAQRPGPEGARSRHPRPESRRAVTQRLLLRRMP